MWTYMCPQLGDFEDQILISMVYTYAILTPTTRAIDHT